MIYVVFWTCVVFLLALENYALQTILHVVLYLIPEPFNEALGASRTPGKCAWGHSSSQALAARLSVSPPSTSRCPARAWEKDNKS